MKKFFVMLVALLVAVGVNVCSAETDMNYSSVPVTHLKDFIGDWYSTDGEIVLTIGDDYRLNGNKTVSVGYAGDAVASYKVNVYDGKDYVDVYLQSYGSSAAEHNMLIFNKVNALRRTQEPQYFESIGGLYLGMNKEAVVQRYGYPTNAEFPENSIIWEYDTVMGGFSVTFEYGVVSCITMYSSGDRYFDRSGLSAKSSRAEFEQKYNTTVSQKGNIDIGHGEVISIGNDSVSLRFFTPGYAL